MVNAFLNSLLDETIYVGLPEGMGGGDGNHCLLLLKALYGLKQAPRLWQLEFSKTLTNLGLRRSSEEICLYQNEYVIMFFFVDNVITLYHPDHEKRYHTLWAQISMKYEARNMGEISWFLGMRIIRDHESRSIYLCQDAYIEKIANRFHLLDKKGNEESFLNTPLPTWAKLTKYDGMASKQDIHLYQQKIGSLLFPTMITQPDIALTTSKLSSFMSNPSPLHIKLADHCIKHMYKHRHLAVKFGPTGGPNASVFTAASDAAFADNPDRKSSQAYIFMLYGGPIDWVARRGKTVTTSITEAELLVLSKGAKQMMWWNQVFKDLSFNPGESTLDCDNHQTVQAMIKNEPIQTRLRHIDIHNHWLRQEHQAGHINIRWIPTNEMPADGLTKALAADRHRRFVQQLGMVNIRDRISG